MLARLTKPLGTCISLIATVVFFYPLLPATVNAQASGQDQVKALVDITISPQIEATAIELKLDLTNTNQENVLTTYSFPNLWNASKLASPPQQNNDQVRIEINSEDIIFNFESSTLKPQSRYESTIKLISSSLKAVSNIQYFSAKAANLNETGTVIQKYIVNNPQGSTNPDYINLKPEFYTTNENSTSLKQASNVFIIWGQHLEAEIAFQSSSNNTIKLLARQSLTQNIEFNESASLDSIYKDDSDNIYATFKPANENVFIIKARVSSPDLSKLDTKEPVKNSSDYQRVKTPKKLKPALEKLRGENKAEAVKIDQVINLIRTNYRIKPVSSDKFSIDPDELDPGSEINYAQYLGILNESITQLDITNNIVLVDLNPFNPGHNTPEFWLEICSKTSCRYYRTEPILNTDELRLAHGLGLQIIAFTGLNELAFSRINNLDSEYYRSRKITYTHAQVAGLTNIDNTTDQLAINLQLPAETENFKNFTSTVEINNRTTAPIFLNSLVIENNTFPIIDNSLGGIHEGVLPGETKSFTINNVFLPKFFLGIRERSTFDLKLNYEKNGQDFAYNTQHSVLLEQNLLFMSLLILGVLSLATSMVTISLIYQHNKYLFISSYWRTWRSLEDWRWRLNKFVQRLARVRSR